MVSDINEVKEFFFSHCSRIATCQVAHLRCMERAEGFVRPTETGQILVKIWFNVETDYGPPTARGHEKACQTIRPFMDSRTGLPSWSEK